MTATTPAPTSSRPSLPNGAPAEGAAAPARVAPPPKSRRRPAFIALGVVLAVIGGLGAAWLFSSSADSQEVLTVRATVSRGEVITDEDLTTIQLGLDPALKAIPAAQKGDVVGKRAAFDIVAGGVITAEQITDAPVPAAGFSRVGLSLGAAMLPAQELRIGDKVRVVTTAGQDGTGQTEMLEVDAVVANVIPDALNSGETLVNIELAEDEAAQIARHAASGNVALVQDSPEN